MKKLLLIDGNNMLFKAYHATNYGQVMKTSNGLSTNAIYGFANMIQKALDLINPDAVLVAWDSGKPTFRHEQFSNYKGTRKPVDEDLILQMPIAREYLDAYAIKRYEQDGVEADDIIGTIAKNTKNFEICILSSDKDLWQLINEHTSVYVMKKGLSEIEIINESYLKDNMGIVAKQIIELKALMGDTADNIPGVKGVGEKTALKLLHDYQNIENLYDHLDEVKGKLKEKLMNDKELAYLSKELATIKTDVTLPFTVEDLYLSCNDKTLLDFYRKYEMNSFLKRHNQDKGSLHEVIECQQVHQINPLLLQENTLIFLDINQEHYMDATLYGFCLFDGKIMEYINLEDAKKEQNFLDFLAKSKHKNVCDSKQFYHACNKYDIITNEVAFDIQIAAFLLDGKSSDYEKLSENYNVLSTYSKDEIYGKKMKPIIPELEKRIQYCKEQAKQIYPLIVSLKQELVACDMMDLFETIELPLSFILTEMEKTGVHVNIDILDKIADETSCKLQELSQAIYTYAEEEFNINSPKQLSVILYDKLGLPSGKKKSTAADVLEKLKNKHPIIPLLLEHRKYSKLYSTYAQGLKKHVYSDGRIHTIFNQTLTQTGRLSSSEPNLQNISVKDEEAKEIRKAFVAAQGAKLMSADYSQIELRILAHMANEQIMIDAFQQKVDIHTKTAMQIFDVQKEEVDAHMRRCAKTVNFGIVYGQSDFGLSEQLHISRKEAKEFIDKYFISYPQIQSFMQDTIAFCLEHGYVNTLFKRRRYIPEIHDKNYMIKEFGKRAAMNAPIQGSAADLIKVAMIHIYESMQNKNVKSKMILQIHDELIFEVLDEELDIMKQIVEEGMQQAMQLKVPLVAEASIAQDWYHAK